MKLTHLVVCLLFLSNTLITAQESLFDLFQQQELLHVTLETDFHAFQSDKRNEEYQSATFTYKNANEEAIVHNIKVRQRGKYRRRICEMPPLKLNFDKDELVSLGLRDFDKMKLVTYCLDDPNSKESIVREYLAYQIYNELTPHSYRTQLVKITYIDTNNPKSKIKRFGFLIESTKELEERIGGEEIEAFNVEKDRFNPKQEALVATFQYMIGNADWSTAVMRNVKMIQPKNGGKLIPVPYDFDFSGMVDASYAIPNNSLGLTSIKERAFLGIAENEEALDKIKIYFERKKDDLYNIIENCRYLSRDSRYEIIEYLNSYYTAAEF